jgi:arsenate reductase (thioredoxin)
MAKRRKRVSRVVWRASHAAWPAAAETLRGIAGRAMTALRVAPDASSGTGVSRVIFACIRNAGRSQMAVAFFNQLADPRRARALSAGTEPSGNVDPKVIEAMRETGIDLSPSLPRRLNACLAMAAGHLVNMGCGQELPFFAGVTLEDWPIDDPKGEPLERVREIRDEIRRRVKAMIEARGWGRSSA